MMNNFFEETIKDVERQMTTAKEQEEIREFIREVFGIQDFPPKKQPEKEEMVKPLPSWLGPYVDRLEQRIIALEESNAVLTKTNAVQDSINDEFINLITKIIANQEKSAEMFDDISKTLEVGLGYSKLNEKCHVNMCLYNSKNGDSFKLSDKQQKMPEVGKWYLTWKKGQQKNEAEVRTCVDAENLIFVDCAIEVSDYDDKEDVFVNWMRIDENMLGKFINGKKEIGKLYFCHDGDKRYGIVLYARSNTTYSADKKGLTVKDGEFTDIEFCEEIKPFTLGK